MKSVIHNPKLPVENKPYYPYKSYSEVFRMVKEKGLENEPSFRVEFYVTEPLLYFEDNGKTVVVEWYFDMDYIKARCFEEAKNLPYMMDEKTIHQAFSSISILKNNYGMNELSSWIECIADNELKRIHNY